MSANLLCKRYDQPASLSVAESEIGVKDYVDKAVYTMETPYTVGESNASMRLAVSIKPTSDIDAKMFHIWLRYVDSSGQHKWPSYYSVACPSGKWTRLSGDIAVPSGMTVDQIGIGVHKACTLDMLDFELWDGTDATKAVASHTTYATEGHLKAVYATQASLQVQSDRITSEVSARAQTDKAVSDLSTRVTQTESGITTEITNRTAAINQAKSDAIGSANANTSNALKSYTKTADLGATDAVKDAKKAGTDASAALDAYKSNVSETYATKAALTQTSDTLSASISDALTTAKSYTDSSITTEVTNRDAAIQAKADSISLEVSKTYAKQETFDSYKNSNDEAVSGVKATADSAASDLAEYKTSVSETYATKASLTATDSSIRSDVSSTYLSKADAESTYATSTSLTQTASDLTATISKAQTTANGAAETASATATMIRQYAGGVLVAKTGAAVGALVNANGSFDVVSLKWSNGVPSVSGTLSSFDADSADIGTAATPGAYVNMMGGAARFYVKQWVESDDGSREVRINASGDGSVIVIGPEDEATNGGLIIRSDSGIPKLITDDDPYPTDAAIATQWPLLVQDGMSIGGKAVKWQKLTAPTINTAGSPGSGYSSSAAINPGLGLGWLSVDMSFNSPGWSPGTSTWLFQLPEGLRPSKTTRLYNFLTILISAVTYGAHIDVHSDGKCYPTWGWQATNVRAGLIFPLSLLGL